MDVTKSQKPNVKDRSIVSALKIDGEQRTALSGTQKDSHQTLLTTHPNSIHYHFSSLPSSLYSPGNEKSQLSIISQFRTLYESGQ